MLPCRTKLTTNHLSEWRIKAYHDCELLASILLARIEVFLKVLAILWENTL